MALIKFILAFSIFISCNPSYSQTLTLKDLISKTSCKTFECFNSFITSKNFSYKESKTNEKMKNIKYSFTSNEYFATTSLPGGSIKNLAYFYVWESGQIGTSFVFATKSISDSLNIELKSMEFKVTKTLNENDGKVLTIYNSSSYPKITVTITIGEIGKDGNKWISYGYSVNKAP